MKFASAIVSSAVVSVVTLFALSACGGGGGSSGGSAPPTPTTTFTVGVTVSGLTGSGLVLRNNGGDNLTIAANGSATFATGVANGSAYAVTVLTQPGTPAQTCTIANASGTIASANVANIAITCSTTTFVVNVTVSGLAGTGLVLRNNGGDNTSVTANGNVAFQTRIAGGSAYAVTVLTSPSTPTQTCVVGNGTGTASATVTNVTVACTTNTYTVSATVSGLAALASFTVQLNGADDQVVSNNGPVIFPAAIQSGGSYFVSLLNQPGSPPQRCAVTNESGTVTSASISNVTIACVTQQPRFGYALNSGDNTITSYAIDSVIGQLRLRGGYARTGTSPVVSQLDPSGKFIYVANSGSANVSAFAFNATTGVLTEITGSPYAAGTQPAALGFHPAGKFLYVANKGAATVSAYAINATTGALTPIGTAVPTGSGPLSVAIDPQGRFAFVLNNVAANVAAYAINATTGALTEVGTRVATGTNPLSLTLHANGKFLYANNNDSANISGYTVNATTGALTSMGAAFTAGVQPQTVRIHPNGKYAYVRGIGTPPGAGTLTAYGINATTGALGSLISGSFVVGVSPSADGFDQSGKFLYVTNFGTGTGAGQITVYQVSDTTGLLTLHPSSPVSTGPGPKGFAIDPSNKYFYAIGTNRNWIYAHSLNGTTGTLNRLGSVGTVATGGTPISLTLPGAAASLTFTSKFAYAANSFGTTVSGFSLGNGGVLNALTNSPFAAQSNPRGVAVDPFNRFAYATNEFDDTISAYTINAIGGLDAVTNSPFVSGSAPYFAAVDPTGRFFYAANRGSASNSIATFAINQTSGALLTIAGAPTGLINPRGVAVDPTGRFVYATNNANTFLGETLGRISGYAIDKNSGALAALTGSPYANSAGTGNSIGAVTVDPSGRFVYASNSAGSSVSPYSINASTGELSALGPAVAAGAGPRGIAVNPNGKYAYVINGTSNDIYGYTIDSLNGFLVPFAVNPIITGLSAPWTITVDYSGRYVYVANSGGTTLSMFTLDDATGGLTAIVGTATTGASPSSVAVTTDIQ